MDTTDQCITLQSIKKATPEWANRDWSLYAAPLYNLGNPDSKSSSSPGAAPAALPPFSRTVPLFGAREKLRCRQEMNKRK